MDKKIEDKSFIKRQNRKYIYFVTAAITVISIFLLSSNGSSVNIENDKITTNLVFRGEFNDYIQIVGQAAPIVTVYLDAVEGGKVEERHIEEGSIVKKGDVILRLSNKNLVLNILSSEAQLAEKDNILRDTRIKMEQEKLEIERDIISASYELKSQQRTYEQNIELYKDKLISRDELLRSEENFNISKKTFELMNKRFQQDSLSRKLQLRQLANSLENMERNLQMVKGQMDDLNIKAPIDGQLGMLDAEVGQTISPGQRIGQINVLTSFKIEASIDEYYIDRVLQGVVGVIVKGLDTLELKVRKVFPDVRGAKFKIELVFTNSTPSNIRTGLSYNVRLELGEPIEALMVERGGFFNSTGGQWVYVLDASGKFATKRNIKIGRQNPQYFEILEGLNANEKIISSSYESMGDNETVILK